MAKDFRASQIQTTQVIPSGSSGTNARIVVYPVEKQLGISPNQGIIDPDKFGTGSIGVDTFLYVSGGISERNTANNSIAVFGGDVHISGNLTSDQQIFGEGGSSLFRLEVVDFASTEQTSSNPKVAGQVAFPAAEFTSGTLTLRAILANTEVSGVAAVKFYNLDSMTFVDIGGPSVQELAVTGTTPTLVESVNLISASGFNTSSTGLYELQLFSSTGSNTAQVGGGELRPSGSFTGATTITQSFTTQILSGNLGFRIGIVDFARTTNTSSNPQVAGQVVFPADEFSGSLNFRTVLSTTDSSTTASVRLFNASSGAYVELQSGQDELSTTNLSPTVLESQNLFGAINFNTSSQTVYEVHIHTSNAANEILIGGSEFRPSGSFTGVTNITSSNFFVSGTWIDSNNELRTTASVAINGDGQFASQYGSDVYFYVSGTINSWTTASFAGQKNISVFGGDVRVSGSYIGGSNNQIVDDFPGGTTGSNTKYNVIAGGEDNIITPFEFGQPGDTTNETDRNFIGAGIRNAITQASNAGVVAGQGNAISNNGEQSFIGAGISNFISRENSFIGAGNNNSNSGVESSIVGGSQNQIASAASSSFIGGGKFHFVEGDNSSIVGGWLNVIDNDSSFSFIGGGQRNRIQTPGQTAWQAILVGSGNFIEGAGSNDTDYSVILGGQSNLAAQSASLLFGFDLTGSASEPPTIQFGSRLPTKQAYRFVVSASRGAVFHGGLSGSLTALEDGSSYLLAGDNITLTTGANGAVTITAATGSGGGGGSTSLQTAYDIDNTLVVTTSLGNALIVSGTSTATGQPLMEIIDDSSFTQKVGLRVTDGVNNGQMRYLQGYRENGTEMIRVARVGNFDSQFLARSEGSFGISFGWLNETSTGVGLNSGTVRWQIANGNAWEIISNGSVLPIRVNVGGGSLGSASTIVFSKFQVSGTAGFENDLRARGGLVVHPGASLSVTDFGADPSMVVTGAVGGREAGTANSVALFLGDVHLSGNLTAGPQNNIVNGISGATDSAAVIAGQQNTISGADHAAILGGFGSTLDEGDYSVILGGGASNVIRGAQQSAVVAGFNNRIDSLGGSKTTHGWSGIFAGENHRILGAPGGMNFDTAIVGGNSSTINDAIRTVVVGGLNNNVYRSDRSALFGSENTITGSNSNVDNFILGSSNLINNQDRNILIGYGLTAPATSSFIVIGGDSATSASFNTTVVVSASNGMEVKEGPLTAFQGLSGSLTRLADGSPYLLAGNNVTLTTESNGAITIAATAASGSTAAAGSENEIQYNVGGALSASNNFWIDPGVSVNVTGAVNMSGDISIGGGVKYNPTFVTASRTLVTTEHIVGVSASATLTLTLPGTPLNGQSFVVKDIAGNSAANNIIVSSSGDQIDGASIYTIAVDYGSAEFVYFTAASSWGVI